MSYLIAFFSHLSAVQIIFLLFGTPAFLAGLILMTRRDREGAETEINVPLFGKIKTKNLGVILFLIGAILILTIPKYGNPLPGPHAISISGRIYDASNNNNIENAIAYVILSDKKIESKPTGSDGKYRIEIDTPQSIITTLYWRKGRDTDQSNTVTIAENMSSDLPLNLSHSPSSSPNAESQKTQSVKLIDKRFSINIQDETLISKIQTKTHYHYAPLATTNKIVITFDSSEIIPDGSDFIINKSNPKVYSDGVFCKFLDTTIEPSETLPIKDLYENARKNCQRVATAYLKEHPEILLQCLK